jgi:ABC-type branched-subunit amino acid transport system ATPase component
LLDDQVTAEPVTARPTQAALTIENVSAGYGGAPIVNDVSATVASGEVVVIIGPNGAGKSTLLKALAGIIPILSGRVMLGEADVTHTPTDRLAREGIGYVPQASDVFEDLTVRENLLMGGYLVPKQERKARVEEVVNMYPLLAPLVTRRVQKLSGGERKLVAIGRALMGHPRVLLLDEPSSGLAPQLSREILTERVGQLAHAGVAVLLVEQRAMAALEVADWSYVLANGRCVLSCAAGELLTREDLGQIFLGNTRGRSATSTEGTHDKGGGGDNASQDG